MASITILSLLLLLAADMRAPVNAPPIIAFFCKQSKPKWARVVFQKRKFKIFNLLSAGPVNINTRPIHRTNVWWSVLVKITPRYKINYLSFAYISIGNQIKYKIAVQITQSLVPRILSVPYSTPAYTPATVPDYRDNNCYIIHLKFQQLTISFYSPQ